jgi:hypothetical protein
MAYEIPGFKVGVLVAAADLSAHQFKFVKMTSTGVALCSAITDTPIGVLQNTPTAGQPCEIMVSGVTKVVTAAALAAGADIGTSTNGRAQAAAGAGATVSGVIVEATAATDQIGSALINCAASYIHA